MTDIFRKRYVVIDYTNWRGERRERVVMPISFAWTHTEHHPVPQWLLLATDVERGERRMFAMSNIHSWRTEA